MKKILLVATYDSFLYSGYKLSQSIIDAKTTVYIINVKNQITSKYLDEYQIPKADVNYGNLEFIFKRNFIDQFDIIILSIGNGLFKRFIRKYYADSLLSRILLIGIFPGVIFGDIASITARINVDLLLCNSSLDTQLANKIAKFSQSQVKILNYGLINLNRDITKNKLQKTNVYFIDQVKYPNSKEERLYILDQLISLAQTYPQKNFIIKERNDKKALTVHKDKFKYSKLIKSYKSIPSNLNARYESMYQTFNNMDMCLSISSSVIIESIFYGIPSYAISDFGISDEIHNSSFLDSDIFLDFDCLKNGLEYHFTAKVNKKWLYDYVYPDFDDREQILNKEIDDILLRKKNIIPSKENIIYFSSLYYCKPKTLKIHQRTYRKLIKLIKYPKLFYLDSSLYKFLHK